MRETTQKFLYILYELYFQNDVCHRNSREISLQSLELVVKFCNKKTQVKKHVFDKIGKTFFDLTSAKMKETRYCFVANFLCQ